MNPNASTTNREKKKNKAFMMVKHNYKLKEKKKRSFRDKQVKNRLFFTALAFVYSQVCIDVRLRVGGCCVGLCLHAGFVGFRL